MTGVRSGNEHVRVDMTGDQTLYFGFIFLLLLETNMSEFLTWLVFKVLGPSETRNKICALWYPNSRLRSSNWSTVIIDCMRSTRKHSSPRVHSSRRLLQPPAHVSVSRKMEETRQGNENDEKVWKLHLKLVEPCRTWSEFIFLAPSESLQNIHEVLSEE